MLPLPPIDELPLVRLDAPPAALVVPVEGEPAIVPPWPPELPTVAEVALVFFDPLVWPELCVAWPVAPALALRVDARVVFAVLVVLLAVPVVILAPVVRPPVTLSVVTPPPVTVRAAVALVAFPATVRLEVLAADVARLDVFWTPLAPELPSDVVLGPLPDEA